MLDWISQPHAGYVIAAYGVAFVALIGIGVFSLLRYRRLVAALRALPSQTSEPSR